MITFELWVDEDSYYRHAMEQEATPEELTAKVAQDLRRKTEKWAVMLAAHILSDPRGRLTINDTLRDDYAAREGNHGHN